MPIPDLAGFTVAITSGRRAEDLAAPITALGARVLFGQAARVLDPVEDARIVAATRACLSAPVGVVVVSTGAALLGWLAAADAAGLGDALRGLLAGADVVGRAGDVVDVWPAARAAADPSWESVLALVGSSPRAAVVVHGIPAADPVAVLRARGLEVVEVCLFGWEPPADPVPVRRVVDGVAGCTVDAVAFTSPAAAVSFLQTADAAGLLAPVTASLSAGTLCACVGAVTAAPLRDAGIPAVIADPPRLEALADVIVENLLRRHPPLRVAGHRVQMRGYASVVDDVLVPLPTGGMALLRELARRPGAVLSRETLAGLLPGDHGDGHAVEVAIARLRAALGDPAMVQTVVKRGYRLAVDPSPAAALP